jgi:hypothetical protein
MVACLSLPFCGIRVGTDTNLEGGSGRSGPRSFLVLRDILGWTKLILFCGPNYFGDSEGRTRNDVDGEDGTFDK